MSKASMTHVDRICFEKNMKKMISKYLKIIYIKAAIWNAPSQKYVIYLFTTGSATYLLRLHTVKEMSSFLNLLTLKKPDQYNTGITVAH
jgi:hypothetical protein